MLFVFYKANVGKRIGSLEPIIASGKLRIIIISKENSIVWLCKKNYFCQMKSLFLIFTVFLLVSCGKPSVSLEHKFENASWNAFRKTSFGVDINDIDSEYILTLQVGLNDDYNADVIDIAMSQKNDDGESRYASLSALIKRNREFINSADNNGIHIYSIIINPHTNFTSRANYKFSFEHRSATVELKGIEYLSLLINKQ